MKSKKFSLGDINRKISKNEPARKTEPAGDRTTENPPLPHISSNAPAPESIPSHAEAAELGHQDAGAGNGFRPLAATVKKTERPVGADIPPVREKKAISRIQGEEELEFDLFRYISIILQRKKVVLLVTLLVTGFSIFQYLRSERLYTAHARLHNP